VQRPAEQREVSQEIHDLVAHELVPEPQRPGEDARVVEHDGVLEAPAADQAPGPELGDVAREAEGPGR